MHGLLGILAPGTALAAPVYTVTDLGTLGGSFSEGRGINASGQVTGLSQTAAGFLGAFLWDPVTGMQNLGTLGGSGSFGTGINASGQVAGLSSTADGLDHAFLWDLVTGMQDLGTLGGFNSYGRGINASGQVTGWSSTADGGAGAFLWDGISMFNLNDLIAPGSGWILGQGLAINDAGQITGSGTIGDESHAFLLTPVTVVEVPEPGMLALMGTGAIGLDLLRRRKGRRVRERKLGEIPL